MKKIINVITLGDSFVGKTSIIQRIKDGTFNDNLERTHKFEDFTIERKYEKKNIIIDLFFKDTVGQEEYQELPMQYIRDSHVVLFVFCDIKTLNKIKERWVKFYKEKANEDNSRFILVGNKSDIFGDDRDEIIKQGTLFAEELNAHFITCSAKSADNMDNLDRYITTEAKRFIDEEEKREKELDKSFSVGRPPKLGGRKGCC